MNAMLTRFEPKPTQYKEISWHRGAMLSIMQRTNMIEGIKGRHSPRSRQKSKDNSRKLHDPRRKQDLSADVNANPTYMK